MTAISGGHAAFATDFMLSHFMDIDFEARDDMRRTPLMLAAITGLDNLVRAICDEGVQASMGWLSGITL